VLSFNPINIYDANVAKETYYLVIFVYLNGFHYSIF